MKFLHALARFIYYLPLCVLGIVLLCLVVAVAFGFFLGAPISLAVETFDIVKMRGNAPGVVTNVEIVHGGKGTSGARITYEFRVNGVRYESQRVFPGFLGNGGTSTGGAGIAKLYPVGQQVDVHFDDNHPARCCLELGWYQWSLGFACAVWGMVVGCACSQRPSPFKLVVVLLAWAGVLYSFGLIFFGPYAVRVTEMHWHLLAYGVAFVIAAAYYWIRRNDVEQDGMPEHQSEGFPVDEPSLTIR